MGIEYLATQINIIIQCYFKFLELIGWLSMSFSWYPERVYVFLIKNYKSHTLGKMVKKGFPVRNDHHKKIIVKVLESKFQQF